MNSEKKITDLTNDEINEKIYLINKRITIVSGLAQTDRNILVQLDNLLQQYISEQNRRLEKDIDSGVVLDTDDMETTSEKLLPTSNKPAKKNVIKKPSSYKKVYKNKGE